MIVAALFATNIVTVLFLTGTIGSDARDDVAVVGEVSIELQQLREEVERRYGAEVLKDLVDDEVIKQMAALYNVKVTDEELERELHFIKTQYGSYDQQYLQDQQEWAAQIKQDILLQKLLVHQVEIPHADIKAAYESNKDAYEIPAAYHLSQIVVKKKKEAQQIYQELQDGASFSVLAMEKSTDDLSAEQKGDIGFITKNHKRFPSEYREVAADLKEGTYSKPFKTDEGYVILYLHERLAKKTYAFDEVKSLIERQLALEEMNGALSAENFWSEAGVRWNYNQQD
ncbi:MAG: peptidyl-prolyl cis-trans isomerase [Bacillus sp. (in: firmicutes)]